MGMITNGLHMCSRDPCDYTAKTNFIVYTRNNQTKQFGMPDAPATWTLNGFVEYFGFVHRRMLDQKFVWVLGAGASYPSGIPLGSELVDRWLNEIYVRANTGSVPLEEWATAARLEIPDFKYANRAAFYPKIYHRRFAQYPDEGFAYLESLMSGKDPSPGYSILAATLAADPPRHNVVITTNFDNLVADALSIYTDSFPFVCGHETLTSFVRVSMRRPLICKIHRDLLLGPQNDPRSLRRLHDAWGTALRALFQHYTPIFIGYGGNDDTLMDLLESLQPGDIKGQFVWCYHEHSIPSDRIQNVVCDHRGVLVPVPDFDLLMVLLGERMEIKLLDAEIENRARERTGRYRKRIQTLDTVKYPSVTKALTATLERSGGWWAWYQKAASEKDPIRAETVYRQGLAIYPESAALHCNFGVFLAKIKKDDVGAEHHYRRSVSIEPGEATAISNLARLILNVKNDPVEAEGVYRSGLEKNPKSSDLAGTFASFLWIKKKVVDKTEVEMLFRKATKEPNAELRSHFTNFAQFLTVIGKFDEANLVAASAWAFLMESGKIEDGHAEITFTRWILDRVAGRDGSNALGQVKTVMHAGFERTPWSFEELLAATMSKLSVAEQDLARKLSAAILDVTKLTDLESDPIWIAVNPIPLPKQRK